MKVKHLLQIDLIVPACFPEIFNEDHDLNALRALLSLSDKRVVSDGSWQGWLADQFNLKSHSESAESEVPIAALAALGEGFSVGDGYWMHADPVYMGLQRDCVVVQGGLSKEINTDESQSLLAALNAHFADVGLVFFRSEMRGDWYVCLEVPPKIKTTPLFDTIGTDIHPFMPTGEAGALWRSYLNECQMLLHEHPVNVNREQAAQRPINSLWFWGGGCLSDQVKSEFTTVIGASSFAKGLALMQGLSVHTLPDSVEWLLSENAHAMRTLVVQDGIEQSLIHSPEKLSTELVELEKHWFEPLLQALKKGRLDILRLHLATSRRVISFELKSNNLWKHRWQFWRRPQPLKKWLA